MPLHTITQRVNGCDDASRHRLGSRLASRLTRLVVSVAALVIGCEQSHTELASDKDSSSSPFPQPSPPAASQLIPLATVGRPVFVPSNSPRQAASAKFSLRNRCGTWLPTNLGGPWWSDCAKGLHVDTEDKPWRQRLDELEALCGPSMGMHRYTKVWKLDFQSPEAARAEQRCVSWTVAIRSARCYRLMGVGEGAEVVVKRGDAECHGSFVDGTLLVPRDGPLCFRKEARPIVTACRNQNHPRGHGWLRFWEL